MMKAFLLQGELSLINDDFMKQVELKTRTTKGDFLGIRRIK